MLKQSQTHVVTGEQSKACWLFPLCTPFRRVDQRCESQHPFSITFCFDCFVLFLFSHLYHLYRVFYWTNLERWHGFHAIFACDICGCIWSHRLSNACLRWKVKVRCHAAIAFQLVQCLSSLQTVQNFWKQSVHEITCFHKDRASTNIHKDRVKHYIRYIHTDSGQWQSLARWQPVPPLEWLLWSLPSEHTSTYLRYLPGLGLLYAYWGGIMKWQIGQNQQAVRPPPLRRYLWNFDGKNAFHGAVVLWSALPLLCHVPALFALLNVTHLLNKIYNALSSSSPSSKGSLTEGTTQRRSCFMQSTHDIMISTCSSRRYCREKRNAALCKSGAEVFGLIQEFLLCHQTGVIALVHQLVPSQACQARQA